MEFWQPEPGEVSTPPEQQQRRSNSARHRQETRSAMCRIEFVWNVACNQSNSLILSSCTMYSSLNPRRSHPLEEGRRTEPEPQDQNQEEENRLLP